MISTTKALILTGTVGSGKTTTAYAIGGLLRQDGVPHAVIDLDELRRGWPAPADDPFGSRVELANLAAVAANYVAAGARRLVLAGVVEGEGARERYAGALGMPVTIIRLKVASALLDERLLARHDPGDSRDWHLRRSGELEGILDREAVADATIRVHDDPAELVAERVLEATGWA